MIASLPSRAFAAKVDIGTYSFGGSNHVVVPHADNMSPNNGAFEFLLTTADVEKKQGLLSKDGSGYQQGGHLSVWIERGKLRARIQSHDKSYEVDSPAGLISAFREHAIKVQFGDAGLQVFLDGALVASNAYTGGLGATDQGSGNAQPLVIGGLGVRNALHQANRIENRLSGTIRNFALINETGGGAPTAEFVGADSATPVPVASGNIAYDIKDGTRNDGPLSGHTVNLQLIDNGGIVKTIAGQQSDAQGKVYFSLTPANYRLESPNPRSFDNEYSSEFDGASGIQFVVGTPIAELGATLRLGTFSFHGENHVYFPHQANMLSQNGEIRFSFTTTNASRNQGLVSKDGRGYQDGGHLSISVQGGKLKTRLQSHNETYSAESPADSVTAYREYQVRVAFGSGGLRVFLDGQLVASNDFTGGMGPSANGVGNLQPLIVGALGVNNSPGLDDKTHTHFEGTIKELDFVVDGDNDDAPQAQFVGAGSATPEPLAQPNQQFTFVDAGQDNQAFAQRDVVLQEKQSNDRFKSIRALQTDADGQLLLSVPNAVYRFEARSSVTNDKKYSREFDGSSGEDLSVGQTPMLMTLTDARTGQAIPEQSVTARAITDSGTTWIGRKSSDSNGQIVWEIDELSVGEDIQFSTRAFDGIESKSPIKNSTEAFDWQLGSIQVSFADGSSNGSPLDNHEIVLKRVEGSAEKYVGKFNTDENGQIIFDVPEISQAQPYVLETKSVIDGRTRYKFTIDSLGAHVFNVGSQPLTVSLLHGQSGQALAGVSVSAYMFDDQGKRRFKTRATSDDGGVVRFDIPELNAQNPVMLTAKVFNNSTSDSELITAKGPTQWALGTVKVRLIDGTSEDGAPLANTRLDVYTGPEGQSKHVKRVDSDAQGIVLMDLPTLSATNPHKMRANSPVDSRSRYQLNISEKGGYDFVVGSTPLVVNLTHDRTNEPLDGRSINLRYFDTTQQKWVHASGKKTDASGQAVFDVQNMDSVRQFRLDTRVFNNFTIYSESFTAPGTINLTAGKIQVQVKDGSQSTRPPFANQRVSINTLDAEGNRRGVASATTDDNGLLQLDLLPDEAGRQYVLRSRSKTDNRDKTSPPIGLSGDYEFVVGNEAVQIQVIDLAAQTSPGNTRVGVMRKDEEGDWTTFRYQNTDENDIATFDLDGINNNVEYRFKAAKYSGSAYTDVVTSSGTYSLEVGTLPVTLSDRETGELLRGKRIRAQRFRSDGNLQTEVSATTNDMGQAIFDLAELGDTRYILRADRPFSGVRHIYSPVITSKGPVNFAISEDDDTDIDTQAPQIAILAPLGHEVVPEGFVLAGNATDDKLIERIEIQVEDNFGNSNLLTLSQPGMGDWQAAIPGNWLTLDAQIAVTATAYDRFGNVASSTRSYLVVEDTEAPELLITSHDSNDVVNLAGFTIIGTVSDDFQVAGLNATLTDSALGEVFTDRSISIDYITGQWALYVGNGQVGQDSDLTFSFNAVDASGNMTDINLALIAQRVDTSVRHLLARATFGFTPLLEDQATQMGAENWLEQQLEPADIDDSNVEAIVAQMSIDSLTDLRVRELTYQLYSKRQLMQVMAWFWENHFSTDYRSHGEVLYEAMENSAFRAHALGNFRDLLASSAKSPAMLFYLNNAESRKGRPNENYAREIMELSTMGVNGGYTAQDIQELARILTGWQIRDDAFFFNADDHDFDEKIFLGQAIEGVGIAEGETALDLLSMHPSTANFLCDKLINFFISDEDHPFLQQDCANAYLQSNGEVTSMLRAIFSSSDFNAPDAFAAKVKTPLELYVSTFRALNGIPDLEDGLDITGDMGMPLFQYPAPDGFSDEGSDWINVDAMMQRTRFASRLSYQGVGGDLDIIALLDDRNIRTADAIVGYLFSLLLNSTTGEAERLQAIAILNEGGEFDLAANDAELKLQRLLATVLSYPGFQYQ